MDTNRLCPSCQKPLAPDGPMGLCPECLIKAGFPTGAETDTGSATQPAFIPPTVEEIAKLFPQLEILELIGRGGMGAVYKARQKQLNRFVALKILPPGIGDEPAFAERFTREAQALAQLNHPNIVTLYEFGETSGQFYFLMEFVDGVNLRQLLASSRVSPREALAIVPQICDALQFAHDQGIVHRDIKPENIMLDRRGRVKVADFGLAKLVGGESESDVCAYSAGSPSLTDAGKVMGTPNYMAPEQKEHPDTVDNRADIYALGVVFYQMLTGELPGKKIEPPSSKVQIDVRLDEVVLRALEKQPELRYQQVSEVKTMVETIVAMNPNPMATPAQPQPSARTMDDGSGILQSIMKTRISIILLIIVAFALATASAALYWRHLRPWQHVVNLDSFYQVRKASASPHSQSQNSDNNLNKFPAGYRIFNDVRFNVAGLLQLANAVDVRQTNSPYPTGAEGIPVNRFCRSIHLLHGTTGADGTENGTVVASLILHYADGTTNKLDIIYGQQVYDWWFQASDADAPLAGNTKVAWVGENSASKIRVFQTSFANPKPEVKIESVDYVSGLSKCAPFLLALTVEFPTTTHSLLLKTPVVAAVLVAICALILLLIHFWRWRTPVYQSNPVAAQVQPQPSITNMNTNTNKSIWPWAVSAVVAVCLLALGLALFHKTDTRLRSKVKYTSKQASVQDIVQSLAEQVGLKYDWQKSFDQTEPLCQRWVFNVAIEGKTCDEALEQVLKPVGLRYQVEKGVLVLSRQAKAIKITPNDAGSYHRRGDAKQDKNDFEGAIADYTKALELAPDDEGAYHRRGDAEQGKNDWDGAIADYTKAIELKPDDEGAYHRRGDAEQGKNDWDGAIADYTKAIELKPDDAGAYFNRSLAKKAKGDLEGASADHSKAIELQPDLESH